MQRIQIGIVCGNFAESRERYYEEGKIYLSPPKPIYRDIPDNVAVSEVLANLTLEEVLRDVENAQKETAESDGILFSEESTSLFARFLTEEVKNAAKGGCFDRID